MKKVSKILAIVLSLALLLCGIVIVASAEDEVASAKTADGTDKGAYTTVADAITAAGEGGTVTLLADVSEKLTISNDLTLDLGGKTITASSDYTVSVNAGVVTIMNGNIVNTKKCALYRKDDAQVTVKGCQLKAGTYGIYVDATPRKAPESGYHLDIQDSTVEAGSSLLYINGNNNLTKELYDFDDVAPSLFNVFRDVDGDGLLDWLFWHEVEAVSENPYGVQYVGSDGKTYTDVADVPEGVTYKTQELFLAFYRTKINIEDSKVICALNVAKSYVIETSYLTTDASNSSYNAKTTNCTDVAIKNCYVETNYNGYRAFGGRLDINNTLTVSRAAGDLSIPTIMYSNGRMSVENSAFLHPNHEPHNKDNKYFRYLNSGNNIGNSNYPFGDNVYFSSASNLTSKNGHKNLVALDVYGAQGYIYNTEGEAELPTCFAFVKEKFGIDVALPAATGNNYYEDFENSKVTHTPATEDTAGSEYWIIRGVELVGQGSPTVENGYYELDTTTAGTYDKLFTDTAIYLGQYNTELDVQKMLSQVDKYKQIDGVNDGYVAFDGIGLYTVDFDLNSDVDVKLFLNTVDEELADAYTGYVTVAKTNNEWNHITLVTKVVNGSTVTNAYVNGEFVGAANFNTSAAVGIKGVGIKMSAGDNTGTVKIDNVSIKTQASDYTAADVLFERVTKAPLTAWADSYAEAQVSEGRYVRLVDAIAAVASGEALTVLRAPSYAVEINKELVINTNGNKLDYELGSGYTAKTEGDSITVTANGTKVKWYLDKDYTTSTEKSYAPGEEIVLPEDAELVREYETYLDSKGNTVDAPYAYDANGELYFKTELTGASNLEKLVWNGEWDVTENEDGSLEYRPVYVGGIASITAPDGTVTYYSNFLKFEEAFEGSASEGATAKLMSDIATPRLRAKSATDSALFTIKHSKSLDLNGHSLYSEHAYFSGSKLTYIKTRVFQISANVTFNLYSSQPGGAVHTAATVFYASTGSTVNVGEYTDPTTGEIYSGNNLSAYCSILWLLEGGNGATINANGGFYNRKSDFDAFLLLTSKEDTSKRSHSNVAVFKNATIVLDGNRVVKHQNNYDYETDPTHSTFTFENCTFIGNGTKDFSNVLDYADVEINNCYFHKVKLGFDSETNKGGSKSYKVTANNLIFSGNSFLTPVASYDNASETDFTVAKMDAYNKEYKDLKTIKGKVTYSYTVIVDGTPTTYTHENQCLAVKDYFDATVSATVIYTKDTPATITWTAGDVTETEAWISGSTPTVPEKVAAKAEAMGLEGYYSYEFDTPTVATEDDSYEAKFVLNVRHNLVLHSNFTYNVYVPIDRSEEPSLVITSLQLGDSEYSFENGTTTTIAGIRYYVVSAPIDPSNAAAKTALTVRGTVSGTEFEVVRSVSVVDYATQLVSLNLNEQSNMLAKAILTYVKAAYVYFGNTGAEEYARVEAAANANPIDVSASTDGANTDLSGMNGFIKSACLNLEGAPKFRFYLTGNDFNVEFTYTYGGKTKTLKANEGVHETTINGETRYYVEIELRAYEFCQDIKIKCGEVTGYYNLATYYANSNKYNVKLMDLVEALATYADAAKAYKDSLN